MLGIAHYIAGEYSTAARLFGVNKANGGPTGPHMDIFRASTYAELGEDEKAMSIIGELVQSHPDYPAETWLVHRSNEFDPTVMGTDEVCFVANAYLPAHTGEDPSS